MKRYLSLILLVAVCVAFSSCALFSDNGGEPEEPDNLIYNANSDLQIVYSAPLTLDDMIDITDEFANRLEYYPRLSDATSEPLLHEMVFGKSNRSVSLEAYRLFDKIDKASEDHLGFLVYSDGSSIAIAYDEDEYKIAFTAAADYVLENLLKSELTLQKGTVFSDSFDMYEQLRRLAETDYREKWERLEGLIPANSENIVGSIQSLFELYTDGMVTWLANLYDPDICVCNALYGKTVCENHVLCGTAGWYFTNSARDTIGYMPDVESIVEALGFLSGSGIGSYTSVIPSDIAERLVDFAYNLQDPDGYFYHPHWGKNITVGRRGRDLTNSLSLLNAYGRSPKYRAANAASRVSLPNSLSSSGASLVSFAVFSETLIPDHLKTTDAFIAYLEKMDINNNSYHFGNEINAQMSEIKARGQEYLNILGKFYDDHQLENGMWHPVSNYYAVNGLMKITGAYSSLNRPLPRAEEALNATIDAILSDENCANIVDIWNPWEAMQRILANISTHDSAERAAELRADICDRLPEALSKTKYKVSLFLKSDGSFSYTQKASAHTIQGAPAAVPNTNEGDMNATVIASDYMLTSIYDVLGIHKNHRVKFFSRSERVLFLNTLKNMKPVRKEKAELVIDSPITFDDYGLGIEMPPAIVIPSGANSEIVKDPRGEGNALLYEAMPKKSDSIKIACDSPITEAPCYVFEGEFCLVDAPSVHDYMQIQFGDGGDASNIYRIGFVPTVKGIEIWDTSAAVDSKSQRTNLGVLVKYGEWFSLKIVYCVGDKDTARFLVYFNEKLVAVTDNYYDRYGNKFTDSVSPNKSFRSCVIYFLKDYASKQYFDNLHVYKTNDVYVKPDGLDTLFGVNVDRDPENEKIYSFEGMTVGVGTHGDFAVTGNTYIKFEADANRYFAISQGASVDIPYTHATSKSNLSSVSFDIIPSKTGSGDVATLTLLEKSVNHKQVAFTLASETVGERTCLYLKNDVSGKRVKGISIDTSVKTNLRVDYYTEDGILLFYVNGTLCGSEITEQKSIDRLNFIKIAITAKKELMVDNISARRSRADISEALEPSVPVVIYGKDGEGFDALVLSGASVTQTEGDSEIRLNSSSSVVVPVNERDDILGMTLFELAFRRSSADLSHAYLIEFLSENGDTVVSLSIRFSEGKAYLSECTALGNHRPFTSVSAEMEDSLRIEYYEGDGVYAVYLGGRRIYESALYYSEYGRFLGTSSVRVSSLGGEGELYIDDLRAESYNAVYMPQEIVNGENSEKIFGFDYSSGTNIPSKLSCSTVSDAEPIRVIEALRDGALEKLLSFDTVATSRGMDSLKFAPSAELDSPESYVFEADLNFTTSFWDVSYELNFFKDSSIGYRMSIFTDGGVVSFKQNDTGSDKIKLAEVGEWFNLRVEYYVITENGVRVIRVKTLVDGECVFVGTVPYASGGGVGPVREEITHVAISALKNTNGNILIDNVGFYESELSYRQ